jgi:hypothetical protein
LLSRITDHYLQIIANQAPIGFEAEFVNQHGQTVLYRGILLPYSSDDDTIDFIYGVINWKELADQETADALLLEIDQALEGAPQSVRDESPLADWADSPVSYDGVLDLAGPLEHEVSDLDWPEPGFANNIPEDDNAFDLTCDMELAAPVPANDADWDSQIPGAMELTGAMEVPEGMELADWLASARNMAQAAHGSEDRSRQALYAAISRAYDFSIAAADDPQGFAELVADAGLVVQERAPMTPVVKLVFGADYDKTRLTEYAAVLSHAQRQEIKPGALAAYLASADGGLKGIVGAERRSRRGEDSKVSAVRQTPRNGILRKLRKLEHRPIADVSSEGSEFALLIARRLPSGEVVLVGEITGDAPLFEKAAKKLIA